MTRLVIGYFFSEADSKWVVGKNWNLDDRAVGHKFKCQISYLAYHVCTCSSNMKRRSKSFAAFGGKKRGRLQSHIFSIWFTPPN